MIPGKDEKGTSRGVCSAISASAILPPCGDPKYHGEHDPFCAWHPPRIQRVAGAAIEHWDCGCWSAPVKDVRTYYRTPGRAWRAGARVRRAARRGTRVKPYAGTPGLPRYAPVCGGLWWFALVCTVLSCFALFWAVWVGLGWFALVWTRLG